MDRNNEALKAANGKAKKHYRFRPTALAYAIILLVLVAICALLCVRIDHVCREVEAVRAEQEAQGAHMDAIDCWLVDIEQRTEEIEAQPKLESLGEYRITGYVPGCVHCCGNSAGIAANGTKAIPGETCAADWSILPSGTVVHIEGVGEFTVNDTGSGVKGKHIDVACATHEECYAITGSYEVYAK